MYVMVQIPHKAFDGKASIYPSDGGEAESVMRNWKSCDDA